jgi:hypothetical protein
MYICNNCNFATPNKYKFTRHNATEKHKLLITGVKPESSEILKKKIELIAQKKLSKKIFCNCCNKSIVPSYFNTHCETEIHKLKQNILKGT